MMKTISAILVTLLLAAAAMGQDEGAFLPDEKEYNAAVEKANAERDAKVKAVRDAFVAKLKVEMAARTKAGDLDGAIKIRDRINKLDDGDGKTGNLEVKGKAEKAAENGTLKKEVFLSDLKEIKAIVGYGNFDIGRTCDGKPMLINGKEQPHGLQVAAVANGIAYVQYKLGKDFRIFRSSIALEDTVGISQSILTFKVLGDNKILWESKPVRRSRTPQNCEISVQGVDILELQVICPGEIGGAHSVFGEPHLER